MKLVFNRWYKPWISYNSFWDMTTNQGYNNYEEKCYLLYIWIFHWKWNSLT